VIGRASFRLVPVLFALLVVGLGGLLLVIFFRSPYTHANLTTRFDSAYSRTREAVVGTPEPFVAGGLIPRPVRFTNQAALGQQLFFSQYCASCHGEYGQGATFAPAIVGADLPALTQAVRGGPGAMPAFSDKTLGADQLGDIEAYLQYLVEATSPATSK
jgi:cytochrome c553